MSVSTGKAGGDRPAVEFERGAARAVLVGQAAVAGLSGLGAAPAADDG